MKEWKLGIFNITENGKKNSDELKIELKSVDIILPVHQAQIISYLKLADKRMGFLINFNVPIIKNGFKRFVNNY